MALFRRSLLLEERLRPVGAQVHLRWRVERKMWIRQLLDAVPRREINGIEVDLIFQDDLCLSGCFSTPLYVV